MALILKRGIPFQSPTPRFANMQYLSFFPHSSSIPQSPLFLLTQSEELLLSEGNSSCRFYFLLRDFSTGIYPKRLTWEDKESTRSILLRKLDAALICHQLDESWGTFNDFKNLYGFPDGNVVGKLLTQLCYSCDPRWLAKARDLVLVISREKPGLLGSEALSKLALSFARAQMPDPASVMVRLMLDRGSVPPKNVLRLVFSHLVKSEVGACLAANLLVEICGSVMGLRGKEGGHSEMVRVETMLFNLVLDACVRFNESIKANRMVELMAQVGVVADAHSIVVIGRIHEMNGQRDEMKKIRALVDRVCSALVCHYQQFYDSLLNLHFMFDDIDAAAELLLDLNGSQGSVSSQKLRDDIPNLFNVPIGSHNLKDGLKLRVAPELLHKDFVLKVEQKQELVNFRNGKLLPSCKALAKLIHGYKTRGRIDDLSNFLLSVESVCIVLGRSCLCSDVISACISLGWLQCAHDILDDAETAGVSLSLSTYMALLVAYRNREMLKEAEALLRQMRKIGLLVNSYDELVSSSCCTEASSSATKSDLARYLAQEIREEEKALPSMVYELNSSIYFFCRAKMIGDALKTYRRMQEMKTQPTVQTFAYLAQGYSSLGKFRDITYLWGDMKRSMEVGQLKLSRDLCELLLLHFIQGGYFERVIEVISLMRERNMYVDKLMFRNEFLKYHKNLYKSLKASDARTEAQHERLEYVRSFRKWAGID